MVPFLLSALDQRGAFLLVGSQSAQQGLYSRENDVIDVMVLCCVFSVPVDFSYWLSIVFRWRAVMYHTAPGLTTHCLGGFIEELEELDVANDSCSSLGKSVSLFT
jgi:hypothetical protein